MSYVRAITLVGPPGSGKGTIGKKLAENQGLVYLATGDIVRAETAKETLRAVELKKLQQEGKLVPDSMMMQMFFNHLNKMIKSKSYDRHEQVLLLDGVPRTDIQVATMGEVGFEQVLYFKVDYKVVKNRILKRAQQSIEAGKSPRHDDTPEAIDERLAEYATTKSDLINALRNRNAQISNIDASGTIDEVLELALEAMSHPYSVDPHQ